MTDGRTVGRTDIGNCNIPNFFFKKRGDNYYYYYPPTKSEGYSFGVVRRSVRPDSYLSTYWSDLIHSWYK